MVLQYNTLKAHTHKKTYQKQSRYYVGRTTGGTVYNFELNT